MKNITLFLLIISNAISHAQNKSIWHIGNDDKSSSEFALAPDKFKDFVAHDFGCEDKFFLIGYSKEKDNFSYVLPGPVDTWGGTWPTSGWRTNQVNILFGVQNLSANGEYKLVIKLADYAKKFLPLIKVTINNQEEIIQLGAEGYDVNKQPYPSQNEPYVDLNSLSGKSTASTPKTIEIPIGHNVIKKGANCVIIEVLQGSWIMFDQIQMNGPECILEKPTKLFVRNVEPAKYTLDIDKKGKTLQPLLINVEHLSGKSKLSVELDGKNI